MDQDYQGTAAFMHIQHSIKKILAASLGIVDIQLRRRARDFDSRPLGYARHRMLQAMADSFDIWSAGSRIWPLRTMPDTLAQVESFYDAYLESPFREQGGGSRFNNLLWLFLLVRATRPSLIIDSGTYRGASSWAFSLAVPDCPILSFDIDLSHVAKSCSGVHYLQEDWAGHDFKGHDLSQAMAYFDDHVDQGRRLAEAAQRGIPWLVFDDDFPVTSFSAMAHQGAALPKIEFLTDAALLDVSELRWEQEGREFHWVIDHDHLASLRMLIADAERLPNTSLITGIHQTPYRLVRTRSPCEKSSYPCGSLSAS